MFETTFFCRMVLYHLKKLMIFSLLHHQGMYFEFRCVIILLGLKYGKFPLIFLQLIEYVIQDFDVLNFLLLVHGRI